MNIPERSTVLHVVEGNDNYYDGETEGRRFSLLIGSALVVVAVFGGLIWFAYSQGVSHGRSGKMQQMPGDTSAPYPGFKIYEQPAPPDSEADAQASGQRAATSLKQTPVKAPPSDKISAAKVRSNTGLASQTQVRANSALPTSPSESAARLAPLTKHSGNASANARDAGLPQVAVPAIAPPLERAAKSALATVGAQGFLLQLGAYKSQAGADVAWKTYSARNAQLLSGYGSTISRADLGNQGIWYRLQIAGFTDRDVAMALCDRLKADTARCLITKVP